MTPVRARRLVGVLLVMAMYPARAMAQSWAADLYVGSTTYDAVATRVGATSLVGNVRSEFRRGAAWLSATAPLSTDVPAWVASGASLRVGADGLAGPAPGAELSLDGYAYRDPGSDVSGAGLSSRIVPVLRYRTRGVGLEAGGGRADHFFSYSDSAGHAGLFEVGARATAGGASRYLAGQVRWLGDASASYPFAGAEAGVALARVRLWGAAGRWFGSDLSATPWSTGVAVGVNDRTSVWVSWTAQSVDPLFRSRPRDSWNLGISRVFGARAAAQPAPLIDNGTVRLRLPRAGRSAGEVPPSVAGDFTGWQPMPMRAEGDEWVLDVPLASGVYRFAFVAAGGGWFVPEGYPGRMDDDMGGHVVVLVVP